MYCYQKLSHVIRSGDSLYMLAKHYQTTVMSILALNPGVDPYNLQIGSTIIVCPGIHYYTGPDSMNQPSSGSCQRQMELNNRMRLAWEQHLYWTRMILISIAERLMDQEEVTARLLRNPVDIASIYREYYPAEMVELIAGLLTEHLQIGAALITALRDGNTGEAETLNQQWYMNADQIAAALAGINSFYDEETLRDMLYRHLDLLKQQILARIRKDYQQDVAAFDAGEQEILEMADYFTEGLMRMFPEGAG